MSLMIPITLSREQVAEIRDALKREIVAELRGWVEENGPPLDCRQACAALNLSKSAVWRLAEAGRLTRVPGIGSKFLVTRASVRRVQAGER